MRVWIFDTTLRDGEQCPGATMTHHEKMALAMQLEKLRVDVIEAGFPVASEDDFKAVKEIADSSTYSTIAGLARATDRDVDRAWEAIRGAKKPRIHTFMSSSDVHLKYQFKKTRSEALEMARAAVKRASDCCDDVEFSPMDATRSDPAFLYSMISAAIEEGATVINIPDTVGYSTPGEFGALIRNIRKRVEAIDSVVISTHCHNDLGLAVANSLAGVLEGARQVECTINGIGERAGNASLEEIVMALKTRSTVYGAHTGVNTREIFNTSKMVSEFTGFTVQPNKAIVGRNAFAHESGIHQHGVLANKKTYEIMDPEMIGKSSELVIGKHSGRHAIADTLASIGFKLSETQLGDATAMVKSLADKKKQIGRDDLIAIANSVLGRLPDEKRRLRLVSIKVRTGSAGGASADVRLSLDSKETAAHGEGVGPVDAVANAVKKAIGQRVTLKEYNLKAITGGTNALANVVITVQDRKGRLYTCEALNEDVIMASANALVDSIDKSLRGSG